MKPSRLATGTVTVISGRRSSMSLPFSGRGQIVAHTLMTAIVIGAILGIIAGVIGL
jgi:hypothetical protein